MVLLNEIGNNNMNPPLSFTPSPYKSFGVRKKIMLKLKDLFKVGSIKVTMGRVISEFFIDKNVPP